MSRSSLFQSIIPHNVKTALAAHPRPQIVPYDSYACPPDAQRYANTTNPRKPTSKYDCYYFLRLMPPPFTSKTHTALLASVSVKPASSCKPTDFIFINARPRFPLVRCQSPGVLDEEGIDGFLITLSEEEGQVSFLKAFENNPAPSVHIYDNEYLTFDAAW